MGLLVAVGGVWVAAEAGRRPGAAPDTFVAQVGDGSSRRTVIVDARTGRVVRQVPGSSRQADMATDAVVAPDLRSLYLPAAASGAASACDARWTQVDLATGARRPAFGGLTGVGEFGLSANGRTLAYVHLSAPIGLDWATNRMRCHAELVVRDLASGRQRVWTVPPGATLRNIQLSRTRPAWSTSWNRRPVGTFCSTCSRSPAPARSATASTCRRPATARRRCGGSRAAGGSWPRLRRRAVRQPPDPLRPGHPAVIWTTALDLPVEIFGLDVDRSGRHLLITAAGKPNDQRPATAYVFRDGNLRRVPVDGDCWQADW